MISQKSKKSPRPTRQKIAVGPQREKKVFNRLIEHRLIKRVSYEEYRQKVRHVYDGPKGAILAACSLVSLHSPLSERIFRERRFDLRGARSALDVGSGAGQLVRHLMRYSDPEMRITCFDLSHEMLRRARNRLKSDRPNFVVADLTHLPFPDASFDRVTCGYVLEHVPDPRLGLVELARVMKRGAKMLLLATEDNFSGAMTSRFWCCRTYNRKELAKICEGLGLRWHQEIWFTPFHKALRVGGICVELVKA